MTTNETEDRGEVTELLQAWSHGDPNALEELLPMVLDDLRRMARRYLSRERQDHTLQPTALVNEVYLRLADRRSIAWESRDQFFGYAGRLMRYVLVDWARAKRGLKRGGDGERVPLEVAESSVTHSDDPDMILAVNDALEKLEEHDPRLARVVELKFFLGLSQEEVAAALGISIRTVKRDWSLAKRWLYRALYTS